jgi:hypothetical protein
MGSPKNAAWRPHEDRKDLVRHPALFRRGGAGIPYGILSLEAYLKIRCVRPIDIGIVDLNAHLRDLMAEQPGVADPWSILMATVRNEARAPDLVGETAEARKGSIHRFPDDSDLPYSAAVAHVRRLAAASFAKETSGRPAGQHR